MRQRILSLILLLALLLTMVPVQALAAGSGPDIVIDGMLLVANGVRHEEADQEGNVTTSPMPAGVSYSNGTLTLNHAAVGSILLRGGSLTVVLEGDSTIRTSGSEQSALTLADSSVTFRGPGSLTVEAAGGETHACKADNSYLLVTDGASLSLRSEDTTEASPSVFDCVTSSLAVEGGATLEVLGRSGMVLTGGGPVQPTASFTDCTFTANRLSTGLESQPELEAPTVLVGQGATMNLTAASSQETDSENILHIRAGSQFIVDGGQLNVDAPTDPQNQGSSVRIVGAGTSFQLLDGAVNAPVSGGNGIRINEGAVFSQSGGTLKVNSDAASPALGVAGMGELTFTGGTAELTGKYGISLDEGSLTVNGGNVTALGTNGDGLSVTNDGTFTILSGQIALESQIAASLPLICGVGGSVQLLGGTVHLDKAGSQVVMAASGIQPVTLGPSMQAVDNTTGEEISLDIGEETRYLGSSVTISDHAVQAYSCELSIPTGQVTQGANFTVRAVVSLGAEEGTISFPLPDGVRYVPGSLTVDSKPVTPTGTNPLTVSLKAGGAVRFSAVSSNTGTKTLTANIAAGGETHRETLDFVVSAFDLSLPSSTARLELPVSGKAVPESTITIYEGEDVLGQARANVLGTWSGTITLPEGKGDHTVYAQVDFPDGSGLRSQDYVVRYQPESDEVETLTVTNQVHSTDNTGTTLEESFTINYITGEHDRDYYTFWPDLPTLEFRVEFVKDASAISRVKVVTTDRLGEEMEIPLRYQAAKDAWVGAQDFTEYNVPYHFRVEFLPDGEAQDGPSLEGEYTYDAAGNIIRADYGDGSTYTYTYDDQNQPVQAVGNDVTYFYNDAGLVERLAGEDGTEISFRYDSLGCLSQILFDDETSIRYTRNPYGQLISATDGQSTCYYDDHFQVTRITNDEGTAELSYQADGKLARITYPDGSYSAFTYNADGQVTQVTDGTETVTFCYEGDVTVMTGSDGTEVAWSPSDLTLADETFETGMFRVTDPDGSSVTYTATEQAITGTVQDADGETQSCTYNPDGYLTAVSVNGETTRLDYDEENNLSRITYPDGKFIAYQYDDQGRITQVTDSEGYRTGYRYADGERLAAITDGSSSLVSYTYNADGTLARQDNANGTYSLYTYEGENVASVTNYGADGSRLSSFAYTYDSEGRITSMTDTEGTWTYAYDATGQLTRAEAPDGTVTTYTYDAAGNRTQVTRDGGTTRYTANSENQYTAYGNTTRTYDAQGNLLTETRDGKTARYTWNKYGQLVGYTDFDGTVYEYGYDVFGLRNRVTVNGVTTTYLNDPLGYGMPVASYGAGGEQHYVLSNTLAAVRSGGNTYYYHSNLLGSVTEITGSGGAAVNRYAYDQEGSVVSRSESITNPFTYAGIYGLVADGNGLICDRARYVSAATGSFISKDPAGDRYDSNLYRYVGNDPVGHIDPSGEFKVHLVESIATTIVKNKVVIQKTMKSIFLPDPVDMPAVKVAAVAFYVGEKVGKKLNKLALIPLVGIPIGVIAMGSAPASAAVPDEGQLPDPDTEEPEEEEPTSDPDEDAPPWLRALDNPVVGLYSWSIGAYWWMVLPVYGGAYAAEKWPDNPITKAGGWLGDMVGLMLYPDPDPNEWSDMILDPPPVDPGTLADKVDPSRGRGPVTDPKLYPWKLQPDEEETSEWICTYDAPQPVELDPSGYVYEGIPSNRLSGVTTTLYYSDSKTKPTQNAAESQKWDASAFDQHNPLTTDRMGQYLWMVPDGWWQVKYEKAGYQTAYSDWLPVPPVQTDVNVGLVSTAAATLTLSCEIGQSPILKFSRPVETATVTAQTVQITRNGAALTGTLTPLDAAPTAEGKLCATAFRFQAEGALQDRDVLSARFSQVMTYAGTASSGTASVTLEDPMPFGDVADGSFYYDAVIWAVNHQPQITSGTNAAGTLFSPDMSCTRGQVVTFLWRAMGQPEPKSAVNPFTDVKTSDYYYKAVLWAVEAGVTSGTNAAGTLFSPDATCTRGQIVTFLHRTEKTPEPQTTDNPFQDVSQSAYYYDAVLWAVETGVTSGTNAAGTLFSPDATCTRSQIVTFLWRDME